MSRLFRAGAIAVAIFGGADFAAAQTASSNDHPDLTPTQQQSVSQGLANSPAQPAPTGAQPQVGDKVPDSMTAQSLPGDVTDQVPEVKKLLFVKLPDRIVLIDPDSKRVSEIVLNSELGHHRIQFQIVSTGRSLQSQAGAVHVAIARKAS